MHADPPKTSQCNPVLRSKYWSVRYRGFTIARYEQYSHHSGTVTSTRRFIARWKHVHRTARWLGDSPPEAPRVSDQMQPIEGMRVGRLAETARRQRPIFDARYQRSIKAAS